MRKPIILTFSLAALLFLSLLFTGVAGAVDIYLRADVTTLTMPDGTEIDMWGFARDSSFGALDGEVSIPGPRITVPPGDNQLSIHVDNNLTAQAVSVVIPGLAQSLSPVREGSGQYAGRIRSFTKETPAGNGGAVTYTWNDVTPGTYIYHSGTHSQVQVQMGLYGAVTKDFGPDVPYAGVSAPRESIVFYSEIDPALHTAVSSGNYGPGKAMTSTIDYAPRYFLVNGEANVTMTEIQVETPGTILVRFVNAGLMPKCPALSEGYMNVVAEAGYKANFSEPRYSMILEPLKTKDAVIQADAAGNIRLFDRRAYISAGAEAGPGTVLVPE